MKETIQNRIHEHQSLLYSEFIRRIYKWKRQHQSVDNKHKEVNIEDLARVEETECKNATKFCVLTQTLHWAHFGIVIRVKYMCCHGLIFTIRHTLREEDCIF